MQIDGHVVGNLPATLLNFLLLRPLQVFAHSLRQQLPKLVVLVDFDQDLVRFVNQAQSEGSHARLRNGAIEHNLVVNVLEENHGAQVCLQQQITRFLIPVVQRVVIHLAKGGPNARSRLTLTSDQVHQGVDLCFRVFKEVDWGG